MREQLGERCGWSGMRAWVLCVRAGVRAPCGSRALASLAGPGRALLLFALEETTASGIHRLPA